MPSKSLVSQLIRSFQTDSLTPIWHAFNNEPTALIQFKDSLGTLLHYAATYSNSLDTIIKLIELGIDINVQNERNGDTILHIVCRRGAKDWALYLMNLSPLPTAPHLPPINFSVQNRSGEYALDYGGIASELFADRVRYFTSQMMHFLHDSEKLKSCIQWTHRLVDFDAVDSVSGNTIMHHFALLSDVEMVEYLIRTVHANTFVKNAQGKLPYEMTGNPQIRSLLISVPKAKPSVQLPTPYLLKSLCTVSANQLDAMLDHNGTKTVTNAVECQGYLQKWTNYATGYKNRWFVLNNGILSYYKNEYEYPANCRGSIMLRHAKVSRIAGDRCRFSISNGLSTKIYLRAASEEDAMRWVMFLEESKDAKQNGAPQLDHIVTSFCPTKNLFDWERLDAGIDAFYKLEMILSDYGESAKIAQCLEQIKQSLSIAKQLQTFAESSVAATVGSSEEEPEALNLIENSSEEEEFYDAFDLEELSPLQKGLPVPEVPTQALDAYCKTGYSIEIMRDSLPFKSTDIPKVSLWSFLKGVVGKDLTRLPVPVNYNEPLSLLQRMAEDMQYSKLLQEASKQPNSFQRIQFIAAFAISTYASTDNRLSKPFNPLLGETFEFCHPVENYWYFSEQVSHHPPISACIADSPYFTYWNESAVKSSFKGRYLEVSPEGYCHLYLKEWGEHYSWKKVKTTVQNILFGTMYIEHSGVMHISNHSTQESCLVEFKPTESSLRRNKALCIDKGWHDLSSSMQNSPLALNNSDSRHSKNQLDKRIIGHVLNSSGDILDYLDGFWNTNLYSQSLGELWACCQDRNADYYNFSLFTAMLNTISPSLLRYLPPTDSRLRPDQRALEQGDIATAQSMKCTLENMQRERKKSGIGQRPRWFENVSGGPPTATLMHAKGLNGMKSITEKCAHWRYVGGYWEARGETTVGEKRFSGMIDIFNV